MTWLCVSVLSLASKIPYQYLLQPWVFTISALPVNKNKLSRRISYSHDALILLPWTSHIKSAKHTCKSYTVPICCYAICDLVTNNSWIGIYQFESVWYWNSLKCFCEDFAVDIYCLHTMLTRFKKQRSTRNFSFLRRISGKYEDHNWDCRSVYCYGENP